MFRNVASSSAKTFCMEYYYSFPVWGLVCMGAGWVLCFGGLWGEYPWESQIFIEFQVVDLQLHWVCESSAGVFGAFCWGGLFAWFLCVLILRQERVKRSFCHKVIMKIRTKTIHKNVMWEHELRKDILICSLIKN